MFSPCGLLVTRQNTVVSSKNTISSSHPVSGFAVNLSCVCSCFPVIHFSFACFNFFCLFLRGHLRYWSLLQKWLLPVFLFVWCIFMIVLCGVYVVLCLLCVVLDVCRSRGYTTLDVGYEKFYFLFFYFLHPSGCKSDLISYPLQLERRSACHHVGCKTTIYFHNCVCLVSV